jgi:glycosyltransferase involved in cell wall biosynthesis
MLSTDKNNDPKVSIIIPAYNVAPFIAEALDSVFAQTYRDFEVIVVNDGSTDETERVLALYFDRIIYLRQKNSGPSSARNSGLRRARGRYVALLDGDDVWMPTYLERLVGILETTLEASAVFPNAVFFGSTSLAGKLFQDFYPCSAPVTFERLLTRECYIFGSLIFRRHITDQIGAFDETLTAVEDFDLWLRMSQRGHKFQFTAEPLVHYRRRDGCLSQGETFTLHNYIKVLEKILVAPETTAQQRELVASEKAKIAAKLDLALGKQLILRKEFRAAAAHLRLANASFRSAKLAMVTIALEVAPQWVYRLYKNRVYQAPQ